jgi:hypothetical protein
VSEVLTCFACDQEPTRQCSRCGRPYCDDHGEELCDVCLEPGNGVPSFTLYRGSLLALLIGTALAVWLLVQPSTSEGDSALRPVVLTPTAAVAVTNPTQPAGEATQPPTGTTPGPQPTATVRPAGTAPAGGTVPAGGAGTYTVISGDTLFAICVSQRPALDPTTCAANIRTLNGFTGDEISVGQQLRLP